MSNILPRTIASHDILFDIEGGGYRAKQAVLLLHELIGGEIT